MPFIEVLVFGKRLTEGQKEKLFDSTSEAVKRVLGSTERQIRIALQQYPDEDYFDGGESPDGPDHI